MSTLRLIPAETATKLELLVSEYLLSCRARGLSPRTIDNCYAPALQRVFLSWCASENIIDVAQLDRQAFDRFTAGLLTTTGRYGKALSKHTVHSYVGPVRLFLTWAEREGEAVHAKPQLPRRPRLHKDALSREQIQRMEDALPSERDKLIVRLFGDLRVAPVGVDGSAHWQCDPIRASGIVGHPWQGRSRATRPPSSLLAPPSRPSHCRTSQRP
jgi:hypothetical protein